MTESEIPESGLSQLVGLKRYCNADTPAGCTDYIDDAGYLWSHAIKVMKGQVFIAFGESGVIHVIAQDVSSISPEYLSVAGLDELPKGCSADGTWRFNGETVYQDVAIENARTTGRNRVRRDALVNRAAAAIAMIQCSAAAGKPRPGDEEALVALQQYVTKLRNIKLNKPVWPPVPDFGESMQGVDDSC